MPYINTFMAVGYVSQFRRCVERPWSNHHAKRTWNTRPPHKDNVILALISADHATIKHVRGFKAHDRKVQYRLWNLIKRDTHSSFINACIVCPEPAHANTLCRPGSKLLRTNFAFKSNCGEVGEETLKIKLLLSAKTYAISFLARTDAPPTFGLAANVGAEGLLTSKMVLKPTAGPSG